MKSKQKNFAACRESPDQMILVRTPVIRVSELFINLWSFCFLCMMSLCFQSNLLHSGRIVLRIGGTHPAVASHLPGCFPFILTCFFGCKLQVTEEWVSYSCFSPKGMWQKHHMWATSAQHLNVTWATDHPLPSCSLAQHRQEPPLLHPLLPTWPRNLSLEILGLQAAWIRMKWRC